MSKYPNSYVIDMIKAAIDRENQGCAHYRTLADRTEGTDRSILEGISLDCQRHSKILCDMYKKLEGEEYKITAVKDDGINTACRSQDILDMLDRTEEYRTLLYALSNPMLCDYMHQIITDSQNNAIRLCCINKY